MTASSSSTRNRPRLAPLSDADMTDAQRSVRDALKRGPRGGLIGPYPFWIRQPDFAAAAEPMGSYVRWKSSLSPATRELAILVTGRLWRSTFEWQAHVKLARDAGLPDTIIEALRRRETPVFENDEQAVVYDLAMALLVDRAVTQALYDRALAEIGEHGIVDVIATTGFYTMVSMTLNAFDVPGMDPEAKDFE